MITYVACDLFLSPARVLVNTVNTVGVMGKGIAKRFKQVYPDMFERYQELCESDAFDIGDLWLYKTPNKWVLNFPTKHHWRQRSQPEYVEQGLRKFVDTYHVYGITSISFPLLGCGNGELDWETQVRPLMEKYLNPLPISVFVHLKPVDDRFVPERKDSKAVKKWLRTEPESLAFDEVWGDLKGLLATESRFDTYDGRESFDVEVGEIEGEEGVTIRAKTRGRLHTARGDPGALAAPETGRVRCRQLAPLRSRHPGRLHPSGDSESSLRRAGHHG